MTVIHCKDLTKAFGSLKALDRLSITIQKNKITGLIGRNGAGKTTLLKILAGYWRHTSGEVKVLAQEPFNNLFVSENMIFIDDRMHFSDTLTLGELLMFFDRFYKKWNMDLAKRLFQYFSFHPEQIYGSLSKGKRSTFNALVGLATRSTLTLFDEPTVGMDAAVRKDFYRALLKDYLIEPRTIIISSHHLQEIEGLLEDILLIGEGRKYLHLPLDDLKEYAIGITGEKDDIEPWIEDKSVIYQQNINERDIYVVVKNDFLQEELNRYSFQTSPVSANDLCIYLTSSQRGGIDDVFKED